MSFPSDIQSVILDLNLFMVSITLTSPTLVLVHLAIKEFKDSLIDSMLDMKMWILITDSTEIQN